jgi:hypothetical protein
MKTSARLLQAMTTRLRGARLLTSLCMFMYIFGQCLMGQYV